LAQNIQKARQARKLLLSFPIDLSPAIHALPARGIVSDNAITKDDSSCLKVSIQFRTLGRKAIQGSRNAP
jgi:hypothetical protein